MELTDIWKLLAGLALFIYGMLLLEDALKQLAGRTFKLFLRKYTNNRLGAIFSGAAVTAVLQSSSVVIFMVLAFVGAGVLSMRNALAVVLGSNLGTTLDSWIVATLGFKVNIESFALPVIILAVTGLLFSSSRERLQQFSLFFLGFGLLFFGLDYMKEGMTVLLKDFDFTPYQGYSAAAFLLIGLVLTAIIQSSSATVAIVLSALHTGKIPFDMAAAVVVGADLGTSLKTIFAAADGNAGKKRVAAGNIIFNVVVTVLAYALLYPLIRLVRDGMNIEDPLIALVCFQTMTALGGVILFYPFLSKLGDSLDKRFQQDARKATQYISSAKKLLPGNAIDLLEKEAYLFITRAACLNLEHFHIDYNTLKTGPAKPVSRIIKERTERLHSHEERYQELKQAEGEILTFYSSLQHERMDGSEMKNLHKLITAVRQAGYSAKCMKDILHNRKEFRDSPDDSKYGTYKSFQQSIREFYESLFPLVNEENRGRCYPELKRLLEKSKHEYEQRLNTAYKVAGSSNMTEAEISTMLNMSREIFASSKAMIYAVSSFCLDEKESEELLEIPVSV